MTRDIINYSAMSDRIRVRINVGVAYDSKIEKAKSLVIAVARELDWVLASSAPKVVMRNFGESSVEMQLRVWINNARKRMNTILIKRAQFRRKVLPGTSGSIMQAILSSSPAFLRLPRLTLL
jgi:small-conductance mechanosensitive channel